MKTKLSLLFTFSFLLSPCLAQVPQGFNYQAVARLTTGDPIINTTLPVRITIQADSLGTSIIWQELHSSVTTNGFGLINLVLGKGARQAASTVATFSAIDWTVTPKFIKTEIDYSGWKTMGVSRLWSVPYAKIAENLSGSVSKLAVTGKTAVNDEALFEVKNKDGQTIFAVYNEGVRIYVSDGAKGLKGGFAIGGFGTESKTESQKYLFVSKDSVRMWLDSNPLTKGSKGTFSVGGYDLSKGLNQKYLNVSDDSVRIYINDIGKAVKGGFAVDGFDQAKAWTKNYLNIATDESGIVNPAQNRILWYPLKNAFLAGRVLIANSADVGENSFASGYESKAIGAYSQALGFKCIAQGQSSMAIGYASETGTEAYSCSIGFLNKATGAASVALGGWSTASGWLSFAMGYGALSTGLGSSSIGYETQATGNRAFATGFRTRAYGDQSQTFGDNTEADGYCSTAYGWLTKATGYYSFALGENTIAQAHSSLVLGQFNIVSGDNSTWVDTDPALVIGNGSSDASRNNALTILKNGNLGIGYSTPASALHIQKSITGHLLYLKNSLNSSSGQGIALFAGQDGVNSGADMITFFSPNQTVLGRITQTGASSVVYTTTSDARLKENILNTSLSINDLMKVKVRDYSFINDKTKSVLTGFIAQELYEVLPEAVSRPSEPNEFWGVDYGKVTPLIVKAVQDQQSMIEDLKKENQALKAQNEDLTKRIEKIEQSIK